MRDQQDVHVGMASVQLRERRIHLLTGRSGDGREDEQQLPPGAILQRLGAPFGGREAKIGRRRP
ncbi:MAG: hypothetical protein C0183_19420 [Roseiflexus castenholzii]|nr:MAG: hypothetical protein C0183_19420 [Roseiflexus castenholzii]